MADDADATRAANRAAAVFVIGFVVAASSGLLLVIAGHWRTALWLTPRMFAGTIVVTLAFIAIDMAIDYLE